MGMFSQKNCITNCSTAPSPAPNPDPRRWKILNIYQYDHAYVLKVRYLDCTNFEGVKVMVFKGRFYGPPTELDPHFSRNNNSPVARYKPNNEGLELARDLASRLI
jgi:hypothetical protein